MRLQALERPQFATTPPETPGADPPYRTLDRFRKYHLSRAMPDTANSPGRNGTHGGLHGQTNARTELRVRKTKSPRSLGDFFRAAALRPQAPDYFTMFEMRNVAATVRIA